MDGGARCWSGYPHKWAPEGGSESVAMSMTIICKKNTDVLYNEMPVFQYSGSKVFDYVGNVVHAFQPFVGL